MIYDEDGVKTFREGEKVIFAECEGSADDWGMEEDDFEDVLMHLGQEASIEFLACDPGYYTISFADKFEIDALCSSCLEPIN